MEAQFYIHLSSADSKQYFSKNDTSRFTVKLPEILHWTVGGGPLQYRHSKDQTKAEKKNSFFEMICVGYLSLVKKRLPLLRVLTGRIPSSFEPQQYIPVRLEDIERVTSAVAINIGTLYMISFLQRLCIT